MGRWTEGWMQGWMNGDCELNHKLNSSEQVLQLIHFSAPEPPKVPGHKRYSAHVCWKNTLLSCISPTRVKVCQSERHLVPSSQPSPEDREWQGCSFKGFVGICMKGREVLTWILVSGGSPAQARIRLWATSVTNPLQTMEWGWRSRSWDQGI